MPKQTGTETIKNNKSKKLNNRRRVKKFPPQSLRIDTNDAIDFQTDENVPTISSGPALAVSGPGSRDMMGRPTRGPGFQCPSSSLIAVKPLPPPPNATVVVCVLAGTGRADLWVRNNRGQTPLDLCPADQPLRRALIKCCDAAARARNSQATTIKAETGDVPTSVHQWPPQHLKLLANNNVLSNNTIKAPHCQLTANFPGPSKECSKTLTTRNNVELVNTQTKCINNFLNVNDNITSTSVDVPSQNNNTTPITINKITEMVVSTNLDARNESNDINSNAYNSNMISVYGAHSTACADNRSSTITNYRFVKKFYYSR